MPFNLKEKQSRLSVEAKVKSMEKLLEDYADDYKELYGTTEANLEDARLNKNPDSILNAGLKDKHKNIKAELVEKRLDNEKSMFSDFRQNTSGDIPKLEEKRLANKPVEKEKYQKANQ